MGGTDFWTRFFTFAQNSETDFIWAFLTKLGIDLGATGAAFAMRKKLLAELGGLEAFGNSLLEDMHLGNAVYKMGYKLVLGPFIECHVDRLGKEKSLNYGRRLGVGVKAHMAVELPAVLVLDPVFPGVYIRQPVRGIPVVYFHVSQGSARIEDEIIDK